MFRLITFVSSCCGCLLLAQTCRGDDPAAPNAAESAATPAKAQKPSTRADVEPQFLAFHRRHLLEAYRQHGDRDPKWDLQAEAFLDEWAAYCSDTHWHASAVQLKILGEAAVASGCTDPLVRCGIECADQAINRSSATTRLELARELEKRNESPHLVAVMAAMAAEYHSRTERRDRVEDQETFLESYQLMIEQVGKFLQPQWIKPGEERAAYGALAEVLTSHHLQWPNGTELVAKAIEQTTVDPWIGHMFAAKFHYTQGWAARGTGYASQITPEGRRLLSEHMDQTSTHLRKAQQLRPEWPEAATDLIDLVGMGYGSALETPEQWFQKAVAAELDCMEAYRSMFHFSLPQWGGSNELIERIGLQGLRTGRFETEAPSAYFSALEKLAYNHRPGIFAFWRAAGKERYDKLIEMCAGYENSERLKWKRDYFRSVWVGAAFHAQNAECAEVLDKLGDRIRSGALVELGLNPWLTIGEARALAGPAGDSISSARKKMAEKQWDEAEQLLATAATAYEKNPEALYFTRTLTTSLQTQRKFETTEWIDLKFDEQLTGWEVWSGSWKRKNDTTVVGQGSNHSIQLTLCAPVGGRYEFRGEIGIPKLRYRTDNGGPIFCKSHFPTDRHQSLLIAPSDAKFCVRDDLRFTKPTSFDKMLRDSRNTFTVSVWDTTYTIQINGVKVDSGKSPDLDPTSQQQIGLGGSYWYEGPEVTFQNLQLRRLEKPPSDT